MHRPGQYTTFEDRVIISESATQGLTDRQIAARIGCSRWTVRKWRRRAQTLGRVGLTVRRGRPPSGPLGTLAADLPAALSQLRQALRSAVGADSDGRDTALEQVLDLYGRYRMLTFDRDPRTGEPTVEVAHEALLSSWPRLRGWLDASHEHLLVQRRLLSSAAEWRAAGQDRSFLARGARLAQFAALPAEADGKGVGLALTAEEQEYLAASQAEAERQAATERERQAQELELARRSAAAQRTAANRLRVLFGGAVVFLLVATALALFAFDQSGAATANATEANSQRAQAQNNAATAVANRAEADSQRATAVANGAEANGQRATAVANFSHAQAQRLAAAANTILLQHGPGELVALLSIRSLNVEYSPQGEAALEGAAFIPPARVFSGHTDVVREVARRQAAGRGQRRRDRARVGCRHRPDGACLTVVGPGGRRGFLARRQIPGDRRRCGPRPALGCPHRAAAAHVGGE